MSRQLHPVHYESQIVHLIQVQLVHRRAPATGLIGVRWEGHWRRARWKRHLTRGELLPKFVGVEKISRLFSRFFFLSRKDFLFLKTYIHFSFWCTSSRCTAELHFEFKFAQMRHQKSIMGPSRLCSPSQCLRGLKDQRFNQFGWTVYMFLYITHTSTRNLRSMQEAPFLASCDQGAFQTYEWGNMLQLHLKWTQIR